MVLKNISYDYLNLDVNSSLKKNALFSAIEELEWIQYDQNKAKKERDLMCIDGGSLQTIINRRTQ